ncbi:MAG: glycerol-3-phosphate 1-O-acyltransferase PlsY [Bacillota bacterium]|jgi:glycerol-3-phosphate acyltransferase PlsY|nr:glycerol-3-phosphate 1-O-acyltransferase PlsY [Candidatus Fermentithermobacillaceae bacterium]
MTLEAVSVPAAVCLASYLMGAIPFGFIAARLKGIDITKQGSGNTGATNVLRTLGPRYAVPVLLLDAGKGAAAAYLGMRFLGMGSLGALLAGACAIAGHNWSLFLKFRGGKGVATSAGVGFVAFPYLLLAALAVFVTVVLATRYVSLGSLVAAWTALILSLLSSSYTTVQRVAVFLLVAAITVQHRSNIARLASGTERKFGESTVIRKGEPR